MIRKWYTLFGDPIKVFYSPGWVHMHGIVEPKDARIKLVDFAIAERLIEALRVEFEERYTTTHGDLSKMHDVVEKQIDKIIEGDSDEIQNQSGEGSRSVDTSSTR